MQLHPREFIVNEADTKLGSAILDIVKEFELTPHELLRVIMSQCNSFIQSHAKYGIRRERHRSTKKPGGIK